MECDGVAAVVTVGPHGHGHAEGGVKHGKQKARQQTELSIADQQRLLDRLPQYPHDLPINVAGGEHQYQNEQGVATFAFGYG